ncbi:hypothetical protein SCHPADRAFT_632004 [Schizopora paradoxa]|uniref:Protein kinase domain-containing protein n=1 Tax=Schizopora paradoxa TaxID=27342 RepID=A0A0H2R8U1_9AGAM|nr:hypothetical protein SCHPADRAFT_632004 [Schizopora paradoxa]
MKSSIRKLRRRFHRRDTNKDGTSTETGDTATGVVELLSAGDQEEDQSAVDDGSSHQDGVNAVETKVDAQAQREVVSRLPQLATYDSQRPRPIDVCYSETCKAILDKIKAWAAKDGQPQIMWISGLAGTGKSTVAKTIATWAADEGILGGNYFFSRDMMELRKSSHVIPTIAYHLSEYDPSLTGCISKALVERNGHVLNQEIAEQFRRLIEEPLRRTYAPTITRKRTLLIIDGIDECDNPKDIETIIHCLSSLLSSPDVPNTHIRILFVSRPGRHIHDALYAHNQLLIRLSVEDFVKTSDIEDYLRNGFSKIGRRDWPSKDDFGALVESCGKLFIYASTVIGFIASGAALRTPEQSLQIFLNIKSNDALDDMPLKQLDDLYSHVLLEAIGAYARINSKGMVRFRKILGSIVLLRDHFGVSSLSKLIEEEEHQIWNMLNRLSSILIVPPERNPETPVRFLHPSLLDFLIDKTRCDERFFIDVSCMEVYLFQRCVDIIIKGLKGIVDEEFIPVMCYVCQYWGYHLEKVQDENAQMVMKLDEFVRYHLLKWFKFARVLLGSGRPLFRCMEVAQNWVSNYDIELLKILESTLRSFRVLEDGLWGDLQSTYDAARSKYGHEETRRGTCHPGTRVAVLEEIMDWATSESMGPKIFWLHGSALTGKSAVAMSIAEWADEKGILCGGFFFRDIIESSDLRLVVCSISHDLASFDIAMRGPVVEALERNEDLRSSEDLELQFNALIAKPLLLLKQDSCPILLIVDGLEWCEGATELLTLFFTHLSGPDTSHIRILITSRPTPNICNAFEEYKGLHKSVNLDEVSAMVVRQDIETYLHDRLAQIHETLSLSTPPDWLDHTNLDSLVNDSRNSFLRAEYALRFIGDSNVRNPVDQLRTWLAKQSRGESFENMYPHWVAEFGAPHIQVLDDNVDEQFNVHALREVDNRPSQLTTYDSHQPKTMHVDVSLETPPETLPSENDSLVNIPNLSSSILNIDNRDSHKKFGGFGVVRRAHLLGMKQVAVKTLQSRREGQYQQQITGYEKRVPRRFLHEVSVWCGLHHKNILEFLGLAESSKDGLPLSMVSPWIVNGNITEYIKLNPSTKRLPLILGVAEGVQFLHENGIVHGDIKAKHTHFRQS